MAVRFKSDFHVILAIEQVADMLHAGIDIKDAVATMGQDEHRRVQALAAKLLTCLDSGTPLSDGFRLFADRTTFTILAATERSGAFAQGLRDYASRSLVRKAWRDRLFKVLAYPVMLLGMCYALTMFVRFDVDPSLMNLNATLESARGSVNFVTWLATNFPMGLLVMLTLTPVGYGFLLVVRKQVPSMRFQLPFDRLIQSMRSELFAYRLYVQLSAGISVVDALYIDPTARTNAHWLVTDSQNMQLAILEGRRFSEALPSAHDVLLRQLATVGEQTGDLAGALERASSLLQNRISASFESLSRWLEPVITVLLGLVVGSTVYSVFGPMYQTISQIGQH